MLVLSGYVKDDFSTIYKDFNFKNKYLITSKKNIKPGKLKELRQVFTEIIGVEEYYDSCQVEWAAIDLHKRVRFNRIITPATGEFDIIRAAKLRKYLAIDGQDPKSACAFRDKALMKTMLSRAEVKTPSFQKVTSTVDLLKFIEIYGLPVVVKPRFGVASLNTQIHFTSKDVESFLNRPDVSFEKQKMMVETYVEGEMFHVDGLVFNGKVIAWPSIYVGTAMDMVNGKFFANHLLSSENPLVPKLVNYAKKILSILPTPKMTAFHLELFKNKSGELIFCEIASRAGGGYTSSIWNAAFDIPLREAFYLIQAGINVDQYEKELHPKIIPASVVIPKQTGTIDRIEQSCPLSFVSRYVTFYSAGEKTQKSSDTMNPIASALLLGKSEKDITKKINQFLHWASQNIYYQQSR
ncbi:ATP-grasp domain-containing protein [Candidatus Odyssella acanthamoebae]|uniref:ATP-grasp domain-containing protein n=1 Tax=Candidatus Odyssella acanthamoebae TaxID=91604 RepID=A0A077ATU7_9PROT|nr:ATP-grasp domain-containing protein [Candidatus Paracaedibacter acanthamoebae]AIK96617.1 hypothetical protein ID47_07615 [Candidatus Paracaedibacter acanthamoebae]